MTVLTSVDGIADHLGDPRDWTVVLDFDGVLSELVEHPDAAAPVAGAAEAVTALAEVAEVALLSGRGVDDLAARFDVVPTGVALVGGHGSEAIWPDGDRERLVAGDGHDEVVDLLGRVADQLATALDEADGWLIERKATSVAVHHRRVADPLAADRLPWVRAVLEDATSPGPGFEVLSGKAVLELRLRGVDKGRALAWLHDRSAGGTPLAVGDDVTDEDAFAVAQRRGGLGVKVGDAGTATVAGARLTSTNEVVALLTRFRSNAGPATNQRAWAGRTDRSGTDRSL